MILGNIITIASALIGSSVISSIITTFSKEKNNELEYITNERKIWRDDLRSATVSLRRLFDSKNKYSNIYNCTDLKFKSYAEAKVYFQVRLNPNDEYDNKILKYFNDIDVTKIQCIELGIQILLKNDWERAKHEVLKMKFLTIFNEEVEDEFNKKSTDYCKHLEIKIIELKEKIIELKKKKEP